MNSVSLTPGGLEREMEHGGSDVPLHGETHENDMHGKAENQTW